MERAIRTIVNSWALLAAIVLLTAGWLYCIDPAHASLVVDPSVIVVKAACPADGTTAPTLTLDNDVARFYVVAETETVYLCLAATCATNGMPIPVGEPLLLDVPGSVKTVSCRSSGGTGKLTMASAKASTSP